MEKLTEKIKKQYGITLIALVIIIIVLLILAGVAISVLTGDNGLITKATGAKERNSEGQIEEQIRLTYNEWQIEGRQGTLETTEEFLQRKLRTELNDNALGVEKEGEGIYIITTGGKDYTLTAASGSITSETSVEKIKKSTAKADSYVNYFADIDKDGEVDGVIFVDLLTGSVRDTQQWGNGNGVYTLPTIVTTSNVNTYYISQESYTDSKFGTHPVISPKTTSGEDRFYIMALSDFTTPAKTDGTEEENYPAYTSYYWYKNADNHMIPPITSNNFGEGKNNTRLMIAKWNAAGTEEGYTDSAQEKQDIWKHVQTKYNEGWFIPSRAEWAAFANEIGGETPISTSNYNSTYGLSICYWSSSQGNTFNIWLAYFGTGDMVFGAVGNTLAVRLATTF